MSAHIAPLYNFKQEIYIKQLPESRATCEFNSLVVKPLQTAESAESFRAVARLQRDKQSRSQEPRVASTLMDPGCELNLISSKIVLGGGKNSTLKVHARCVQNIILMNNGKEVGKVREAVYLSFVLDTCDGVATQQYHEWFHLLDDLHEDVILGSAFCREQAFTAFHTRLRPYVSIFPQAQQAALARASANALSKNADTSRNITLPTHDDDRDPIDAFWNVALESKPAQRNKRERVITKCELIDKHALLHKKASSDAAKMSKYDAADLTAARSHTSHTPVNYNHLQTRQITSVLAKRVIDEQKILYKTLKQLSASNITLTADELECLQDTTQLRAYEAATFFNKQGNIDLLKGKKSTSTTFEPNAKNARYFMSSTPGDVNKQNVSPSACKFANGDLVLLQGLVNHADLNNRPARIINYDDETHRYAISVAEPRGFWWAQEENMKSIDPPRAKDDYIACGIDKESGQPTLDPLDKPVHRQYGKFHSEELTKRINVLLEKYKHVFGKDITSPCKFRPMQIKLIENSVLPSNPRFWKNSPAQRAEVRKQLQSMLDMGIVRASTTAIVSNVLLVKRPGMPGKFRFTIDFRDLNDATASVPWQMPETQSQLDRLAGNLIFGCIDLSSYYHQIELDEGSKFLTGFITEDGVFEYNRVAQGLKGACAHAQSQFQGALDSDPILKKYGLRNYFDDLPLAAKTEDEFIEQLEAVLRLGDTYNLKFNAEKSIFGVDSITHVGFIVNSRGFEVDPQRIESLKEIPTPKSMKGVQSALGIWNYIRNFIPNFSTLALPLTNLVGDKKKAKAFLWTTECQQAFDTLKAAALNTKLLANIDYTKPIFIRCDSSQYGAGAVLFQYNEQGQECPVSYASRKYSMAERNYCTFQQEAAAVVWSLEKFANFHQGHHVIVQSDHRNLSWIKKTAMPQLTRWRLRLQDFDFSLEYYEGVKNVVADGLSRVCVDDSDISISIRDFLPQHAAEQSILHGAIPTRCLNQYNIKSRRTLTPAERIFNAKDASTAAFSQFSLQTAENLHEEGEIELFQNKPSYDEVETHTSHLDCAGFSPFEAHAGPAEMPAVEAPPELPVLEASHNVRAEACDDVIAQMHNATVGHNGVLVTLNRVLRADKTWATRQQMINDIDQFISGCEICQKFRKRHNKHTDQRFVIAGSPFSELSVDILKLPKRDCNDNLYIVVIVDSFTRWVSLEPVQDKSALAASRAIIKHIGNFGVPITIRSDGGREFVNDTLAGIEHLLGTKHHTILPYQHQGNSLAEKANRSVLENLRNLIFDKRYVLNGEHQWSDLLPLVQRIMNASFNSSIGCSPSALLFGNNLELDRCLITPAPVPVDDINVPEYVRTLTHNQRVLLEAADQHLNITHAKNLAKWKQDHKTDLSLQQKIQELAANEEAPVWVLARNQNDAPRAKWAPKWTGPFRLLDFKTGSQSVLRLYDTVNEKVVESHINNVELWDHKFVNSAEGLTKIAETDNWKYPIDGILGIALAPEDDSEPQALPLDRARQFPNKHKYLFSVKWAGYENPSWEPYSSVEHTSSLLLFARAYPVLKLVKQ